METKVIAEALAYVQYHRDIRNLEKILIIIITEL